jgi:hypothetical protein
VYRGHLISCMPAKDGATCVLVVASDAPMAGMALGLGRGCGLSYCSCSLWLFSVAVASGPACCAVGSAGQCHVLLGSIRNLDPG